ncbi:translocation/assembly module TamB domain-containing protein [Mucilaginibacter sp. KACC 22063]|uniref:translocation/assembly module TamB domain-containing protein n=1 Tax=Mucilaginibacter sp. KACC 22063 TaxID=3025666 RepID=UPI002366AB12|nr:translocation/assembly module TamB domain-containing protein [Mucilaginibacter sp. KACC 22063]WDF56389.1 translocation/assembly module TamB domain-containing protein [Mucilaginibacter sp. KACC 22063]
MLSIILLIFQYKPVQTWAAKKATAYLSKELQTKVDIKSLYIKPFSSVVLEDLYVLDKQHDTLLRTPKLTIELNRFSIFSSVPARTINFESIVLDNGSVYLKKLKDSTSNLKFIIDYFNKGPKSTKKSKPWTLNFHQITINNLRFRYKNQLNNTILKHQVNFNDVDVSKLSAVFRNLDLKNHLFKARVSNLTLKEKSGFYIKNLTASTTVDTNQIFLQNFFIVTPKTRLRDYFRMKFKSFDDFDDFENKVYMDADFKSSFISSSDVAYFTSTLNKTRFDLGLNGRISGKVNHLKARHLTVTGGQATYLSGNFSLKGLPDWEHTWLDLNFNQLATNKRDLDFLLGRFAGDPKMKLPEFLSKFGNINFTGKLEGLQDNFKTSGTFKTALGRFDPDVQLTFKKVPGYVGKVALYNFDLGTMLDQRSLGRTTLMADINGSGDELKNLNIKADIKADYLVFNKYQYQNLAVNGSFVNDNIKGKVTLRDRNVKLDLKGGLDLNPKNPVYSAEGLITEARLRSLGLIKDTITLSTQLKTHFEGSTLKTLQGYISLTPIRIVTPQHNYLVDSIAITAKGLADQRNISLRSTLMDADLKGNADPATLPAYFKSVAKKYIPSLNVKIPKFGQQNFEFSMQIKNLDPVAAFFAPDLKIPEQGTFNGQFNSAKETATFNGYIKTLKYGKTVFHDLIIDENTSDQFMGVNLSLSKIDLTDSLFIKNITVTNFLKKDSLNFNVKLSDKNAINQLDLYGLVEFGRDTTAKLKLLPSDVILENEKWHLDEQVRIRLLDGKTQIENFELTNGTQKVNINGFIASNNTDKLTISFDKFSMVTLDQLTRAAGVHLKGTMNGDVKLVSLLKSPGAAANLSIDSLNMNGTDVGKVKIASTLDNSKREINSSLNILSHGLETMNIGGIYRLDANTNNFDFNVIMNQTPAVIFEPFVSGLVSGLKGTVSTNLKLTGSLKKPLLNGDLTLANTGLTVDYLKTSYIINDKLDVKDNLIEIQDMKLSDGKGGVGNANGTVSLADLSNPDIHVTLTARKLMALNTTFKDNRLYYGTAFATGDFAFNGPVDNMKIDIKARTEDGTIFNIPLNTSATAGEYDYIRFVSHKDSAKVIPSANSFNGVTLNFDLSADEKTVVRITTDYGALEGRGTTRNLKLNINSLGDFEMYGDYLISSGKFEFTAKNFISKIFQVNQGGTIRWTGDPANAEINMQAIYEVRTNIADLYTAAGLLSPTGSRQELVQAKLILTNTLAQPTIDFDFTFPTDPSVKDDLGTYLTDYNNRSQQALSLIVRRQFASGYGNNFGNQVKQTAQDAVSEFAFNKLNNLIAQSNLIKGVDINFRSASDASASWRLFHDRLILNGSLYSNNLSNNLFAPGASQNNLFNGNLNNFTKDFEIDYLIRSDGRLRARYSYRVLNSTTLNSLSDQLSLQYVNGIGLIYQRDFDNFGEFFKSMFSRSRRKNTTNNTGDKATPASDVNDMDKEDEKD